MKGEKLFFLILLGLQAAICKEDTCGGNCMGCHSSRCMACFNSTLFKDRGCVTDES